MKKNSFRYREDLPSDTFESVVDINTGQEVHTSEPKVLPQYLDLLTWSEERRGYKFIRPATKQFKAFKIARLNGIQPSDLKQRWGELENDSFWKEKGFDWMDVVMSFNKKKA